MSSQPIQLLASLTASLLFVLSLSGCGKSAKVESGPYLALGEVAAKATAGLLEGSGKIVLLVNEDDNNAATAVGKAIAAFRETIKKSSGVQIIATEAIKPNLAAPMLSGLEPLPAPKFLELVSKYASADALVSFVGMPRLTAEQIAGLPAQRPKVVAAVTYNPPMKIMFEQRVLYLAIVSQAAAVSAAKPLRSSAEWFEANYQLITPETATALPF
jgi:hypothetical protein